MTDAEFDRLVDATATTLEEHDRQCSARSIDQPDGTSRPAPNTQSGLPTVEITNAFESLIGTLAAELGCSTLDLRRSIQARRFTGSDAYHAVVGAVAEHREGYQP